MASSLKHLIIDPNLDSSNTSKFQSEISPRTLYSKLRNSREQATFSLMMRMAPAALAAVRQEFFIRNDHVKLHEFIFIMMKHLVFQSRNETIMINSAEQRDFASNMFELFKEVDMNGDGFLEWEEFTKFTVEKASLLNKRYALTGIPMYYDSSRGLDSSAKYRHRHDISHLCPIPKMGCFALTEDHKSAIWIFNSRSGKLVTMIRIGAVPLALDYIAERDLLAVTCADMTMMTILLDDPMPQKRFQIQSVWPTPFAQMSLAWLSSTQLLYSGSTNGIIYSWDIRRRTMVATLTGHTDIVMNLLALKKLDNLVSASLDSTIGVWDTYTNTMILRLEGHKKGVFSMSYNPDYRLLISCGFDHDAFVWSPFVNSLVYRLKGHHSSLVGVQCVDNSPEIITADASGIFKVWDIRSFQCIQTFTSNDSLDVDSQDKFDLVCFFHVKLPGSNPQLECDARIFAATNWIYSFDQMKVVHEQTTDSTEILWTEFVEESSIIITASDKNVIIWDALLGSKTIVNHNICGGDITACCLDDRKRKIIIGDTHGKLRVYNPLNGALMKTGSPDDVHHSVQALQYIGEHRRFIAGFSNGYIRLYDESKLDECLMIRAFDFHNGHTDLTGMSYCPFDKSIASAGSVDCTVMFWDCDTGKCDFELPVCEPSECIVHILYLSPFPLLVTSDSMGNVIVWGSVGCRWKGSRIAGFLNYNPPTAEYEQPAKSPRFAGIPMDASTPSPSRASTAATNGSRKIIPTPPLMSENYSSIYPSENLSFDSSTTMSDDNSRSMYSVDNSRRPSLDFAYKDGTGKLHYIPSEPIEEEVLAESVRESQEGEHKWGPIAAALSMAWDPENFQLYTGDELGNIRKWDLKDLIDDLGGENFMTHSKHKHNPDLFKIQKYKPRDYRSAMVPIADPRTTYVLGRRHMGSYLSIEFCWAVSAHRESILFCIWTKHGLLTSSTDRMLKMWTSSGKPIGVLMEGVPMNVKSQCWDLQLDVETILRKDADQLDDILNKVIDISKSANLPSIDSIDPSDVIARFSVSTLRKRIEQSHRILGLVFENDAGSETKRTNTYEEGGEDILTVNTKVSGVGGTHSKASQLALDEAGIMNLKKNKESDVLLNVRQRKQNDRSMKSVIDKYESKAKVLPEFSSKKVMEALGDSELDSLSVALRAENPLLGRGHSKDRDRDRDRDAPETPVIKVPSPGKRSPTDSIGKKFSSGYGKGYYSGSSRAESIKSACSKYSSFGNLELALSRDSKEMMSKSEKEEARQRRLFSSNESMGGGGGGGASRSPAGSRWESRQKQKLTGNLVMSSSSALLISPTMDMDSQASSSIVGGGGGGGGGAPHPASNSISQDSVS